MGNITWEKLVQEKFRQMLEKIPPFLRAVAEEKVEANRSEVTEKDMVDAFFAATPCGFHGPMKVDMESLNIDYTKYGYERDEWKKVFGIK